MLEKFFKPRGITRSSSLLVVGLGNPGPRYASTRHNMGAQTVKQWAAEQHLEWKEDRNIGGRIACKIAVGGARTFALLPGSYMNESGSAVAALFRKERIAIQRLLLIYDDVALPFGKLRLREGGSSGGHNGVKSVMAMVRDDRFVRFRIGVGAPPAGCDLSDYVLGTFTNEEAVKVPQIVQRCADILEKLREALSSPEESTDWLKLVEEVNSTSSC